MNNLTYFLSSPFNQPYFYILLIADLVLRGLALYKSARKEQKIWFVSLLIFNTAGLLPIVYLVLQKMAESKTKTTPIAKKKRKAKR